MTFKMVKEAWDKFNELTHFEAHSSGRYFVAREKAWKHYTVARDVFLLQTGQLSLQKLSQNEKHLQDVVEMRHAIGKLTWW